MTKPNLSLASLNLNDLNEALYAIESMDVVDFSGDFPPDRIAPAVAVLEEDNQFTGVNTFESGGVVIGSATLRSGTGTPEGAVTGNVGDLFLRTDGGASTTLYVKESGTGNTGWVAK